MSYKMCRPNGPGGKTPILLPESRGQSKNENVQSQTPSSTAPCAILWNVAGILCAVCLNRNLYMTAAQKVTTVNRRLVIDTLSYEVHKDKLIIL